MRVNLLLVLAEISAITALAYAPRKSSSRQNEVNNPFPGRCGRTAVAVKRQRIIGGISAKPHSFPWMAFLHQQWFEWSSWFALTIYTANASGSLLRVSDHVDESDIVITCRHCVQHWKKMKIYLGVHSRNWDKGEVRKAVDVAFPEYDERDLSEKIPNEIALIKLDRPVKFTNTTQPICLPQPGDEVEPGEKGFVVGWGRTRLNDPESESESDTLRQIRLEVNDNATGERAVERLGWQNETFTFWKPESIICGGYFSDGKNPLKGDSGGPYVFSRGRGYTLHGIASFVPVDVAAEPERPSFYVRVSHHLGWINRKTREMSDIFRTNSLVTVR